MPQYVHIRAEGLAQYVHISAEDMLLYVHVGAEGMPQHVHISAEGMRQYVHISTKDMPLYVHVGAEGMPQKSYFRTEWLCINRATGVQALRKPRWCKTAVDIRGQTALFFYFILATVRRVSPNRARKSPSKS
jgi:hypothetical protein